MPIPTFHPLESHMLIGGGFVRICFDMTSGAEKLVMVNTNTKGFTEIRPLHFPNEQHIDNLIDLLTEYKKTISASQN